MFPQFYVRQGFRRRSPPALALHYQKVFEKHLSPAQDLTLQLLILLVQSHRTVSLGRLAQLFPQPIKYESRMRNLPRFLHLPQLSSRLLWFPIIKQLLKQEFRSIPTNRRQRRRSKKLKLIHQGYLLLVIDRTQWQERNLMMLSLVWGRHAIPVYWQLLKKKGSSSLQLLLTKESFSPSFTPVASLSSCVIGRPRIS